MQLGYCCHWKSVRCPAQESVPCTATNGRLTRPGSLEPFWSSELEVQVALKIDRISLDILHVYGSTLGLLSSFCVCFSETTLQIVLHRVFSRDRCHFSRTSGPSVQCQMLGYVCFVWPWCVVSALARQERVV